MMNIAQTPILANEASEPSSQTILWSNNTDLKPETVAVKVKTIIDPLTFISQEDKIYRLSGLDSPSLSDMDAPAEFTEKALEALKDLILDKEILVYLTQDRNKGRVNHMGHTLVQAKTKEKGEWVQGTLLANGFARVRTTPYNIDLAKEMYEIENKARKEEHGLWTYPQYEVRSAKDISSDTRGFQVIEGNVYSASLIRNTVYLNFAQDWKTDFSIGVKPMVRKALSKTNQSPQQWVKKKIRIRGSVRFYNGAFIDMTHTEQIEFLDE